MKLPVLSVLVLKHSLVLKKKIKREENLIDGTLVEVEVNVYICTYLLPV